MPEKFLTHVKHVLLFLERVQLSSKLKKCSFFTDSINILGRFNGPSSLKIFSHTTDTIKQVKVPRDVTDL